MVVKLDILEYFETLIQNQNWTKNKSKCMCKCGF